MRTIAVPRGDLARIAMPPPIASIRQRRPAATELVALHPNYAMGLFQKTFGTTFSRCLAQHRIAHCLRLLITSDRPVTAIGHEAGFRSLSRFHETFRRVVGCTPREYRCQRRQPDRS